jgi:hypothetical protein
MAIGASASSDVADRAGLVGIAAERRLAKELERLPKTTELCGSGSDDRLGWHR